MLGGFGIIIGNAVGLVISIFLVSWGFLKYKFIVIAVWFFLIVNIAKLFFFYKLNLIIDESLVFNLWMLFFIGIGIFLGVKLLFKIF